MKSKCFTQRLSKSLIGDADCTRSNFQAAFTVASWDRNKRRREKKKKIIIRNVENLLSPDINLNTTSPTGVSEAYPFDRLPGVEWNCSVEGGPKGGTKQHRRKTQRKLSQLPVDKTK